MLKTSRLPAAIHELLERAAKEYGSKVAFKDGKREVSFQEIKMLAERLAKHFLAMGLQKGDVLAVQMGNSFEFAVTHLAAGLIGLVFNPLSPNYRRQELSYMLKVCDTKALIVMGDQKKFDYEGLAHELKEELPHLSKVIVTGNRQNKESISFSILLEKDPTGSFDVGAQRPLPDDPILIMFTSGTESNPKAVLHTSRTFVATHLLNVKEYGLTNDDTLLSLTPLSHMFSLPMIMLTLQAGAVHYLAKTYKAENVIDIIQQEQVSFLIAAPAHLLDILHNISEEQAEKTNLRLILTGGTKIPSQLVKDLRDKLGCNVVAQWGMTEVCAGTFTRPEDPPERTWETVGRASPTGKVVIVNESHEVLPPGERGEIAFKGDCLFKEYYKNPNQTKLAFTDDGYFLTGDQGYLNEDGYVYFLGRSKDTINRGGLKYHAAEIEDALHIHPKIQRAAIVSVPDERLGEKACAFIVLRNSSDRLTLDEIKKYLIDKGFATYKIPEYLEIRNELPTTASGKIAKGPLRSEAQTMRRA